MYFRILAALALIAVVGFFGTGCEVNVGAKQAVTNGVPTSTTNPTSTTQTNPITQTTTPIPTNFVDELDVSGAITYGTHADFKPQNAQPTQILYKSDIASGKVYLDFQPLTGWPLDNGTDGGVCIFWYEGGNVVGGMFDWHGVGQTIKLLENIYGGYLAGHVPKHGDTVWFCIIGNGDKVRTTVTTSSATWD